GLAAIGRRTQVGGDGLEVGDVHRVVEADLDVGVAPAVGRTHVGVDRERLAAVVGRPEAHAVAARAGVAGRLVEDGGDVLGRRDIDGVGVLGVDGDGRLAP